MGGLVRAEFDRQLQASPELANRVKKDLTVKIYLKYRYGITKFAMSGYKPYLALGVAVIDGSGKEIWKGSDHVGGLSGLSSTQSMDYAEYFSSPDKFRSAFDGAAKVVMQSLLKKFSLPE